MADPVLSINYEVKFLEGGMATRVVEFSEASGFDDEIEFQTYYEGNNLTTPIYVPKQRNIGKVTLSKGTDDDMYLVYWYQLVTTITRYGRRDSRVDAFMNKIGQSTIRRDVEIKMFPYLSTPSGDYQRVLKMSRALPTKMMWAPLNALRTQVHIEKVVFVSSDIQTDLIPIRRATT